jgi:hypothetical protein
VSVVAAVLVNVSVLIMGSGIDVVVDVVMLVFVSVE